MARMPSAKFFEVLRGNADIAVRLIELLVFKIRKMSERVFEVSALGVRERVRRELLRLATEGTAFRNGVVVQPAPTHYEIAARIGSHREAVTREFNRLESENIIEVRRKQIRIIDLERLKHADGRLGRLTPQPPRELRWSARSQGSSRLGNSLYIPPFMTWPRISPPLLAAVWTLKYHLPAARSAACASVRVASPLSGLTIPPLAGAGTGTTTPALVLASAGPWKCAAVAGPVRSL